MAWAAALGLLPSLLLALGAALPLGAALVLARMLGPGFAGVWPLALAGAPRLAASRLSASPPY